MAGRVSAILGEGGGYGWIEEGRGLEPGVGME